MNASFLLMYIQKGYAIARHLILLLCLKYFFTMSFLYTLKYHMKFPTVNSKLTVFYSISMHGSIHIKTTVFI